MSDSASSSDGARVKIEELSDSSSNAVAVEAISERLSEVTGLAEELDQALRSAQQDCAFPTISTGTSSVTIPIVITPSVSTSVKKVSDVSSVPTQVCIF